MTGNSEVNKADWCCEYHGEGGDPDLGCHTVEPRCLRCEELAKEGIYETCFDEDDPNA